MTDPVTSTQLRARTLARTDSRVPWDVKRWAVGGQKAANIARFLSTLLLIFAVALLPSTASALPEAPAKPRVLVLTDIGNEPDDSESLVRFLLYANEFDVEGIIATTSTWQRDKVRTDLILERIAAYGVDCH
ncbi:nucleoside hydrolase-like domain-containing protein [Novosphingobium sp.]|uniref:nucleoside hydrolase-like domain-containing protein n=1 Tax=Novosphingobium sp. TaxID=1874826 RepID=UPI0031D5C365